MADDKPIGERIEEAVGAAINDAVAKFDNGFTVKWVSIIEVIDVEGERGIWTATSAGAKRWDIFGLLKELEHYQMARTVAEMLGENNG